MSLTHPVRIGSPVSVWFADEMPDRVVHETERYRVVSPALRTPAGWAFRAVRDDGAILGFEIEGGGAHWQLSRVVDDDWPSARRSA